ncbi:MAG TPA: hypothetical protein VII66_10435 [Gemmatimonadaceae bacterium]
MVVQRALEFTGGSVKLTFEIRDATQQHVRRLGFTVHPAPFPIAADDYAEANTARQHERTVENEQRLRQRDEIHLLLLL